MSLKVKRIYERAAGTDGFRVLIDRIWPRGLSKDDARVDLWLKEAAPSTALRKWFAHDPEKWDEFRRRYGHELDENREALDPIYRGMRRGTVTLLFGAREERFNNAIALQEYLARHSPKSRGSRGAVAPPGRTGGTR